MLTTILVTAAVVAVATLVMVLVVANLTSGEKKIEHKIERRYASDDPQFPRSMSLLLGPPVEAGNRFEVLVNGDEIFPSMLAGIRSAQKTITFETFIYWSGEIGEEFAQALSDKARAGVAVHVLLDWVGSSKMDKRYLRMLRDAGAEVIQYHKPHWTGLGRMNDRTHRKLLVIDGQVGFTGGVGIAEEWTGRAQDEKHWRDTHFRVEGPVAGHMQAVFMDNWIKATGNVLHGPEYFPEIAPAGEGVAHMFSSSPSGGSDDMQLMYLMAITAATHTIHLASAYFVPDKLTINAIVEAARRGVKVQIVTPGKHIDTHTVREASRAGWGDLLKAGVEIHEYQPTMFHCKLLIVDEYLVSVGSTNFDSRSFKLNDEANLNIYDRDFAQRQTSILADDIAKSRRVTLDDWNRRPLVEKIIERAVALLDPQL
ncbi:MULTISPECIES: cardiolipin synthase [unclassified Caballeronia]|uniref:cardiolipin synthase n=1 Tax=unclassified Caballeronia TaxID=2646786 RepID=UPI00285F49B5|nr:MULTISPECIES: cardiolipin synthase [unclassified Caballeronia]MDR5753336.1 cardiolipin synthase [Caballeronia sp. LZ024]MDR5841075.1 cardiolipin synthase [Caballeronia sp. LZ031]